MTELESILNYLETTSMEPHDDYTSEFSYKEQKALWEYIKQLQQENQELKKQLEELEKEKMQEELSSKILQMYNQQKEFIEYLEDRIKFWKDKIFENAITESDWTLTLWRNKLGILEESLSKYKEIIGVKDEENMQNY